MEKRDIIVIGASAGGVNALKEIVALLPKKFDASIFIVQHVSADSISLLPRILSYTGKLKAVHPSDGDLIEQGVIYIAPPDRHMIIERDRILIKKGPKENRFRPSIDALFRSAAYNYGSRVVGVVLTGMLDDGTSGMWSVKRLGGTGIIQQPLDAEYPSMPTSVLEYVKVDYVVPLEEIAPLLGDLIQLPITDESDPMQISELEKMKTEIDIAAQQNAFSKGIISMGEFTPFTCPECNGALIKLVEGNLIRYRCHTGHSFLPSSLLTEVTQSVEVKLWQALKNLEEMVMLMEESAKEQAKLNNFEASDEFLEKAEIGRKRADSLHNFIFD